MADYAMSSYAVRKRSHDGGGGGPSKRPKLGDSHTLINARRYNPRPRQYVYRMPNVRFMSRTPGGQITADNHYFDTERTSTAIPQSAVSWAGTELDPNTTAMMCLFAPSQGDDIANRQGRKIFVKKIRISGVLNVPVQTAQAAADPEQNIRIIVYKDKQTNGAQAQGEELIESGAGSDAIHMYQNLKNLGRFEVMYDKYFVMTQRYLTGLTGAYVQAGQTKNFKISLKPNCVVNYNATNGGTVADVIDNSFHLIALTDNNTMGCTITYKVRTVFTA